MDGAFLVKSTKFQAPNPKQIQNSNDPMTQTGRGGFFTPVLSI
jgi:hypothetical protein